MNCKDAQGTSLALGTFDGIHLGHAAVIRLAVAGAEENGLRPAALLFTEHPQKVLTGKAPPLLTTGEERDRVIRSLGAETEYLSFSEIYTLGPEEFVKKILAERFRCARVACGYNYRFGRDAGGDTEVLRSLCEKEGIAVSVAPEADFDGAPISSSRIRSLLEEGRVAEANAMLGRNFAYTLPVVRGKALGGKMGLPTANQIFPEDFCVPRMGVYASVSEIGGTRYASMTNVGTQPTFGGTRVFSETNLFGFDRDIYGEALRTELIAFIRPERRFDSKEAFLRQIAGDRTAIKKITEDLV